MNYRNNKKTNKNISINESIGFDKDGNEINLIDVIKDNNIDYIENLKL